MQVIRASGVATLCLLLGAIVSVYAQRDRPGERRGQQEQKQGRENRSGQEARMQQERGREAQREQRSDERVRGQQQRVREPQQQRREQQSGAAARQPQQQQRQRESAQQPVRRQEQARPQSRSQQPVERPRPEVTAWQQRRGWIRQGAWRGGNSWNQGRARRWEQEHRGWTQRGGYGGYYIPRDRFIVHFGPQHWFRIHSRPVFYMGYPRFWHGGFSFLILDPWPEYWEEGWYEADDIYVDYDDGYYLYNRRYPTVRLAITVIM